MKKNVRRDWKRIRGLGIARLPRIVVLVTALTVAGGIQLTIPGTASAQQSINSDLTALEVAADQVFLPPAATSAQAGTTQSGTRSWDFFLGNNSQTSVTNPTITIDSGYSPSLFPGVPSFPVAASQASLGAGQQFSTPPGGALNSDIPVSFTAGYDSTRTVSPLTVPAGGTHQTVVITITPADARYTSPPDGFVFFNINLSLNMPGVSVVSTTNPSNLDQGETIQTFTGPVFPFGQFQWRLGAPQLNKQYTFTAVLNVPNPSGVPFEYRPDVSIRGERQTVLCDTCDGSAVTVKDPTLDGSVPGSGDATFSVAETSHTWTSTHSGAFDIDYQGTTQTSDPALHVTRITAAANHGRYAAAGVTFTDDDPTGNLSQYSGTIAWGDGSTTTIPKYLFTKIPARLGGGFAAGSLHTYARPGRYVVTVIINDVGGASDSKSTTLVVLSG
jgi:hypothetical protein